MKKFLLSLAVLLLSLAALPAAHAQSVAPPTCPASETLAAKKDGPAALPIHCTYNPAVSPTGTTVGADVASLRAALAASKCGDTLFLPVATYAITVPLTITTNCPAGKLVTLRSASSALPSGARLTPAYAGVASIPGMPPYAGKVKKVIPTLLLSGTGRIKMNNGFRFVGIEITIPQNSTAYQSNLIDASNTNHVLLDRVWIHGAPKAQITRAVYAAGAGYFGMFNSYANEFHCIANGPCTDAQVIGAGTGASGPGWTIRGNFLSASAENILFGGGGATTTASDITVSGNHFFKPLTWEKGQATYAGDNFSVKNLFELKNAQRVRVYGNLFENNWGGYSQNGFCMLLTPKNQQGHAPNAVVNDVTVDMNEFKNCGAGFQIATARDDNGSSSMGANRISIHDVLIVDVDSVKNFGSGIGMQITSMDPAALLDNVFINHVTFFGTPNSNSAIAFGSNPSHVLSITNSIWYAGKYNSTGTGANIPADCSKSTNTKPATALAACWSNPVFTNNVVIGGNANWPAGTQVPTTSPFVSATDPHVLPAYAGIGADIDAINAALANVN